ncbi:MAG: dihydropteroate synthase [Bacillota bacterium]|nr:dihydropteroate synthase [Bacillota bacterium]
MVNARLINIENINSANREILKTGADKSSLQWLSPKAVHVCIKLEGIIPYAANILKQEMLGKGGDVAVHSGVVNCSVDASDVILMGTLNQYKRLTDKLLLQSGTLREIALEVTEVLKGRTTEMVNTLELKGFNLPLGKKTYIMGILNVTPDSFSDGGSYTDIGAAVKKAREMITEGADIIDIGGESTRPGHKPVDAQEEIKRVVPVIEILSREITCPISVDTMKAAVADKALQAGAHAVNDVWGLQREPEMANIIAKHGAGVIMMHNQDNKDYVDLVGDIIRFLRKSADIAEKAGIPRNRMVVDPGIGFGKTPEHNMEVMRRIREFSSINLPILLGTSRKSFIGYALDLPVEERLEGTAATVVLGISGRVDIIRVHDVKEMARVAKMTDAIVRSVYS